MCWSAGDTGLQQGRALLGALPAVGLSTPEQIGGLVVAVLLGVVDVLLEPQRIVDAGLGLPQQVVIIVLGSGHGTGVCRMGHRCSFRGCGLS